MQNSVKIENDSSNINNNNKSIENICPNCGKPISGMQNFCTNCGSKLENSQYTFSNNKIELCQNGRGILENTSTLHKNKTKFIIIIVGIIGLILVLSIFGYFSGKQIARDNYYSNVNYFIEKVYTATVNLEDISDTTQTYWYESIWDDKYGGDIDQAVEEAQNDKIVEIRTAKSADEEINALYKEICDNYRDMSDKDSEEYEVLNDSVEELYSVYCDFYMLAVNPTGNYNSYSSENSKITNEFISAYKEATARL